MNVLDFKSNYLNQSFEVISRELKTIFILGDFNIKLLNYN